MYGGLGYWKFYITEVDRIELEHQSRLPEGKYTNEEIQAGFKRVADAFGISLTLDNLVEKTRVKEDELLTWSVKRLYYTVERFAWSADAQKKYSKIMTKPKKK